MLLYCTKLNISCYQEFLLEELVLELTWGVLHELTIGVLDGFLSPACVVLRVDCFYGYHYWVVIIFDIDEVFSSVEGCIDDCYLGWELLLKPIGEFEGIGTGQVGIRIETYKFTQADLTKEGC